MIFAFHALGLALEIFKVHQGRGSYPGDAVTKVAGRPAVLGFHVRRGRVLHLPGVAPLRPARLALSARGRPPRWRSRIYANFFTHHYIVDLRMVWAVAGLWVLRRCRVHFTVGDARYRMPLALSFLLIGFFLWLAENARHVPRRVELPRPGRRVGGGARREARRLGAAGLDELRAGGHREGPGGPALPRAQRAGRDVRRSAGHS